MATLNKRLQSIRIPNRMVRLKTSSEGYPVPWFVPWVEGKPEFRAFDPVKLRIAIARRRCWLCGEQLGRFMSFVIGPMCMVNKVNAEPPSHHECAQFAVLACPFLTQPRMRRNEKDMPEHDGMAGIGLLRNPGVSVIWTTLSYTPFPTASGIMLQLGEPAAVEFWAEGRPASRREILDSIDSGLPALREVAGREGPAALARLMVTYQTAIKRVPAEPEADVP
jgi:hypothetical protein